MQLCWQRPSPGRRTGEPGVGAGDRQRASGAAPSNEVLERRDIAGSGPSGSDVVGCSKGGSRVVKLVGLRRGDSIGARWARDLRVAYGGAALGFVGHGLMLLVHHQDGAFGKIMHKVAAAQALALGALLVAGRPYFAGVAAVLMLTALATVPLEEANAARLNEFLIDLIRHSPLRYWMRN